jgi:trans-L-3-hydroxyproline dehydratase
MLERREWARAKQDHLRRAIMLEPRGHADMYGALLTEPERPGSHAGVLFMHNDGYSAMCGHGIIAVVTIAIERGLLSLPTTRISEGNLVGEGDVVDLLIDAPAGQIRARAHLASRQNGSTRVERVSFVNVPSFVLAAGVPVTLGSRTLHADVAFGGAFYAIVDAEAAGLPIAPERLPELRAAGVAIARAVEKAITVAHPMDVSVAGLDGTIFTGPPTVEGADLRNVAVFGSGEVDRSPCGTGTCAVLAVIDAMGLSSADRPFVHESLIGTTFSARVAGRTTIGEIAAINPEITGAAWITGEHHFVIDDKDKIGKGFRI